MANTIITKNSSTASAVPTSGDLVQGELAVNVTDKRLFTENASGTVVELGVNPTSITTGNLTASGATTISVTDNSNAALRITQLGTGNALLVEDSSNPDSTPFVINASGFVSMGGATAPTTGGIGIKSATAYGPQINLYNSVNDANPSYKIHHKDRAGSIVQSGDNLGIYAFFGYDGAAYKNAAQIAAAVDGTPGTNDMPGRLVFSTTADGASTPTERMRIRSDGVVQVGANAGATINLKAGVTGTTGAINWTFNTDGTNYGSLSLPFDTRATDGLILDSGYPITLDATTFTKFNTNGSERMRIDSAGNVGIGTSSPNKSSSSTALTVNTPSAANYAALELSSGDTLNWHINSNNAAVYDVTSGTRPRIFYTNGSERMRIDSAGNVGIGLSGPSAKLHVYGDYKGVGNIITSSGFIRSPDGSAAEPSIQPGVDGDTGFFRPTTNTIGFSTGGTERARIDSSGNLLVGTTSNPAGARTRIYAVSQWGMDNEINTSSGSHIVFKNTNGIIGSINSSGSTTSYNTSSDYRLKEDWVAVADASTRVNALKPVNFAWKANGSRVDGFLAHELAEVVPEAVTGEKDAVDAEGKPQYQGIDQSKLVPLLTAALQEALAQIESLTARVSALEGN